jgi:hypothetical protein
MLPAELLQVAEQNLMQKVRPELGFGGLTLAIEMGSRGVKTPLLAGEPLGPPLIVVYCARPTGRDSLLLKDSHLKLLFAHAAATRHQGPPPAWDGMGWHGGS